MNLLLKDCLNKLSLVMKSKGNSLTDNIGFNSSMELFIGSQVSEPRSQNECCNAVSAAPSDPAKIRKPVKVLLSINRENNDFLKDVIISTEFDRWVGTINSIKNLDYNKLVIEIREVAFTKYDSLELLSIIMNSLTQGILTTTAATRYISMINEIYETGRGIRVDRFNVNGVKNMLSNYVLINPIESVINEGSMLTAHNIMVDLEMDEVFNSVLPKIRQPITVERAIEEMNQQDAAQLKILSKYLSGDPREFRGFLEKFIMTYPYTSIKEMSTSLIGRYFGGYEDYLLEDELYSFISPDITNEASFFGLGDQSFNIRKYRFKLDSIKIMIQNMESNDEKQYIRAQIYKLEKELNDHDEKRLNSINKIKNPTDEIVEAINLRYTGLKTLQTELTQIRDELVKTKPSPRRIGLYVEYPAGWEG